MATQHCEAKIYPKGEGRLDIPWVRDNYFTMTATFPYDISGYTYEAAVTDKAGVSLASMVVTVLASAPSGIVNCSLSEATLATLPNASYWYLDEIDSSNRNSTKLAGLFTLKVKGAPCQ
jgi:hypothetical protein